MSKILVTGASGFLGSEVIRLLKKNNLDFVGVSRNPSCESYVPCDLSDPKNIIKLLEKTQPNFVINLAAKVDFNEKNMNVFFPVNVLLPAILGNYCRQNRSFLIHSSGIIVHGFSHKHYNMNTELLPDTSYGISKLNADNIIESSGCEAAILRLGGIYGMNGPLHLGMNKAIVNAKKSKVPVITGSGNVKRNYIFVNDAAKAILKCLEERITGTYYLGGETKTIKSMLNDICEVFIPGKKPKYNKGGVGSDQIIENSKYFKITPFRKALEKMK